MDGRRIALDSAVVTALNATTQVASFVLFAGVATLFGANWQTDAFFLALTIPALFTGPVVNSVSAALFPVMIECRVQRPEAFGRLVGSALLYVLVLSVAAAAALALGTPSLLRVTTKGLSGEAQQLVMQNTLVLLPIILTQSLIGVLGAAYNSAGRFWLPATAGVIRPVATLGLIVACRPLLGITSLSVGFVGGTLVQLAVVLSLWPTLRVRPAFGWRIDRDFGRSLRLALPLILGTVALQCSLVISRFLAARLSPGSVTVLDYASRISTAITELLTGGALLVIFADWSAVVARGDTALLRAKLRQAVLMVLFTILPVVAVLLALREPTIALLLQRGRFDAALTATTAGVFAFLLLGLPLDVMGQAYVRLFLARQDTWVIGRLAVARLVATTAFSLVLMRLLQVRGLALATALAHVVVLVGLVIEANRRIGNTLQGAWLSLGRLGMAAAGAWLAASFSSQLVGGEGVLVRLPLAVAVGLVGYLGVARLLGIQELTSLMRLLKRGTAKEPAL